MYKALLSISDDASGALLNLQKLVTGYAMEAEWTDDPESAGLSDDEIQELKSIAVHFESVSANIESALEQTDSTPPAPKNQAHLFSA